MRNANSAGHSARAATAARTQNPARVTPVRLLFALYAWSVLLLLGVAALPALLLLPRLAQRRAVIRFLARLILRLIGMRVLSHGIEQLPHPCIVVANHSSYLDGVVLAAMLPPRFSFVIKREMSSVPLAGTLLRRIGAEFVERRDRKRGARDARRLLRNAQLGQALAFFPEGTFEREVGLLHFHIGAFAAAVRARSPLVPIAIRGTRHCLPPGTPWPRPGRIEVTVLAAIAPAAGGAPQPAVVLRDAARGALLLALGEPDLDASASSASSAGVEA